MAIETSFHGKSWGKRHGTLFVRVVRYAVGVVGGFLVWLLVAIVVGWVIAMIFPPPGGRFLVGVGLDWRNLPGTVLGFFAARHSFRASVGPVQKAEGKRRKWPWVVPVVLLVVGSCSVLSVRFFVGAVLQARSVAQTQLPVVSQITSTWDLDALYRAATQDLRHDAPESVARAYFAEWRDRLGPSRSVSVAGYFFKSKRSGPRVVVATYDGQFQYGTARVVVQFRESAGAWLVEGINVTDIMSSRPTATSSRAGP